jgi:hypothetical protein
MQVNLFYNSTHPALLPMLLLAVQLEIMESLFSVTEHGIVTPHNNQLITS